MNGKQKNGNEATNIAQVSLQIINDKFILNISDTMLRSYWLQT